MDTADIILLSKVYYKKNLFMQEKLRKNKRKVPSFLLTSKGFIHLNHIQKFIVE
jgi:hypothetical protein